MPDKPFNIETPDWGPLERAVEAAGLPESACGEFMWMGEWREGEHQYKHHLTRRYVVINATTEDAAGQVHRARNS